MLGEFLSLNVFAFLLVFARLGAALIVLPGFGESTITPRVRLVFALALAVVLLPLVAEVLPPIPASPLAVFVLLSGEVFIGLAIGLTARILLSALQVAGTVIAYHTGMAAATMFDPAQGQQGAIMGAFLTTLGVTLLFLTGMHHVMLTGLADSYAVFVPGAGIPFGDLAEIAATLVAQSFRIGLTIAMPVMVVTLLVYVAMSLIARLMPQIHIFFLALPVQIGLGIAVMALTLSAGMLLFLTEFENTIGSLWLAR